MELGYASTRIQLLNQLGLEPWSANDRVRVSSVHGAVARLVSAQYRATGTPFIDHLVRTASIVATTTDDIDIVLAALAHAVYQFGDFGDGTRGVAGPKRQEMRRLLGERAEAIVLCFERHPQNEDVFAPLLARAFPLDETERAMVLVRLANVLEDHLDLGMRYRGHSPDALRGDPVIGLLCELGHRLGYGALVETLGHALDNEIHAEVEPALVGTDEPYSEIPRSYAIRKAARVNVAYRRLRRSVGRAIRRSRGGPP